MTTNEPTELAEPTELEDTGDGPSSNETCGQFPAAEVKATFVPDVPQNGGTTTEGTPTEGTP